MLGQGYSTTDIARISPHFEIITLNYFLVDTTRAKTYILMSNNTNHITMEA
jgi:hypothetical protein